MNEKLSIREILEREYLTTSKELEDELIFRKEKGRRGMTEAEYTEKYGFMQGIMHAKKKLREAGYD